MSDLSTAEPSVAQIPATPAPESASVWEDFIDILYNPSAVFARRENGSWWLPMLVVAVALALIALANQNVMQPIFDAEYKRATVSMLRANPQMTPEMLEQGRQMASTVAKVGTIVIVPIVIFLIGTCLWIIGKFFDAKESFRTALVVGAYAYVPRVIEAALVSVQGMLLDPSKLDSRFRITWGLGRFFDPDKTSPVMLGLLGRIDVFTIWVTVLLVIGLSVTGKISRGRAAVAGVIMWLAGALPVLYQAVRGG